MKKFYECWHMQFENKEYKPEWKALDPIMGIPYKMGTVHEYCDETGFAVYDGATNYMGRIDMEGHMYPAGYVSSYVMSFLKYGKIAIEENYKKLG